MAGFRSCIIVALTLAAAVPVPAMSQGVASPVATRAGPSDIVLQLSARGSVNAPADLITINVPIASSAETSAAARSATQAKIDRLKAALIRNGIDARAISMMPDGGTRLGFVGNEAYADGTSAIALAEVIKRKTAQSAMQIQLSDPARIAAVRSTLEAEDLAMGGLPVLALKDDGPQRRAAVAAALTKVRADADMYAASLGMRVVRITRVSDQGGSGNDPEIFAQWAQRMGMGPGTNANEVTTDARVWVDFVLTR